MGWGFGVVHLGKGVGKGLGPRMKHCPEDVKRRLIQTHQPPNLLLLWRDFDPSSSVGFPFPFARSGDDEGSLHFVGQFVLRRIEHFRRFDQEMHRVHFSRGRVGIVFFHDGGGGGGYGGGAERGPRLVQTFRVFQVVEIEFQGIEKRVFGRRSAFREKLGGEKRFLRGEMNVKQSIIALQLKELRRVGPRLRLSRCLPLNAPPFSSAFFHPPVSSFHRMTRKRKLRKDRLQNFRWAAQLGRNAQEGY